MDIYCSDKKHKINFAYAQGGSSCAKKTVALATGIYIDFSMVVNFEAFSEVVDALGGIFVYLDQPFEESLQWAKDGYESSPFWKNLQRNLFTATSF